MVEVLIGFGFVFLVIGVASVLEKFKVLSDEGARKTIHIGVANWFILAVVLFDHTLQAMIAPVTFIVLNYLSYRFNLVSAMERDEQTINDLGTVYYAISLAIVTLISFEFNYLEAGLFAILAMGYGDGFSAVIGKHFPSKKLYKNKSYLGSLTFFIFTLVIGLILFTSIWYLIIMIALIMTLVELFTPRGLDNLSVPLILMILMVVIGS